MGVLSQEGPIESCLVTVSSIEEEKLLLNPEEEQVWNKKGNKVLNK